MGAAQSSIPTEAAVVGAIVAGGITAYGVYSRNANAPVGSKGKASAPSEAKGSGGKKAKGKKKAGTGAESDAEFDKAIAAANKENAAASARVVRAPEVVPGTFDFNPTSQSESEEKEKKARKRKTKKAASGSAGAGESKSTSSSVVIEKSDESPARVEQVVAPQVVQDAPPSSASSSKKNKKRKNKAGTATPLASDLAASFNTSDTGDDDSWTRVSTRKKATGSANPAESVTGTSSTEAELLTSDTNLTSGATDPDLTETEEEESGLGKSDTVTRKTLTDRLPKARKTGVEDMEDEPLQPTLARVIAVRPASSGKPAEGFNWGDYEEYAGADESAASGADVSNDDAWEQVSSKKKARLNAPSASRMASSTDSLSNSYSALSADDDATKNKKARQNAEKRSAQKAAKDAAEKDRVERLARHKKELEKVRMAEQFASGGKSAVGGGMKAAVGEGGKLVWE